MNISCYSQHLFNPFRGAVNVTSFESAEAVTGDGVHRDIYVRNAELADGLDNPRQVQTSEIRYGKWSAKTGLKRGPLHPSEDFRRLEARGAVVFKYLLTTHDQLLRFRITMNTGYLIRVVCPRSARQCGQYRCNSRTSTCPLARRPCLPRHIQ